MNAKEISNLLAQNALAIASMLLPNGKKESGRWVCGSVGGESGKSLKVELTGAKLGRWADFSSKDHGDLLDLWGLTRNVSAKEAFKEACEYLGIERPTLVNQKKYQRPEKSNMVKPVGKVMEYLHFRGLTNESIEKFKLRASTNDDAIIFPFFKNKELINIKTVKIDRDEEGKKIEWQSKGAEPCLYGWHLIGDNVREIVICEGEIDAISLTQYEYPTLSVNQGAGNFQWVDNDYDLLERFNTIYLCFDNDEAGKKAVKTASERLGCDRTLICTLPYKDANECLQRGLNKADIDLCFKEAKSLDPDGLKNSGEYTKQVLDEFYGEKANSGISLPWRNEKSDFLVRPGEMTVVTGINNHGKSMLLSHLLVHLMANEARCCIYSGEMPAAKMLKRKVQQIAATTMPAEGYISKIMEWLSNYLWVFDLLGKTNPDQILKIFEYAHKRYGVNIFVIDSWMMCGLPAKDLDAQDDFAGKIFSFAKKTNSHVFVVVHPKKTEEGRKKGIDGGDVKGSGGITDQPDNVLILWEIPEEKREGWATHFLTQDKHRHGRFKGTMALKKDDRSLQFLSGENDRSISYVDYSIKDKNIEI